jgi:hypothetical protein
MTDQTLCCLGGLVCLLCMPAWCTQASCICSADNIHPLPKHHAHGIPTSWPLLPVQAATKGSRSASGTSSSKRTTVVPEPSLNVPLGALALSGVSAYAGIEPLAWFTGILGVFLAFQSTRVRCARVWGGGWGVAWLGCCCRCWMLLAKDMWVVSCVWVG